MLPNFLRGLFGQKVHVASANDALDFDVPSKDELPKITINIAGVTASVERGHEYLSWIRDEKGTIVGPRYEADHFAVKIQSDGTNPEYPKGAVDRKIYLVNTVEDSQYSRWGVIDNFTEVGQSSRFTEIVIGERPYKNPKQSNGIFMGRVPEVDYPPHSILSVTAHAVGSKLGEIEIEGQELAVRKSQKDSPAWQAAANSPHYMLDIC